jgi:hypothetical protein
MSQMGAGSYETPAVMQAMGQPGIHVFFDASGDEGAGLYCVACGRAATLVALVAAEPSFTVQEADSLDGSLLCEWTVQTAGQAVRHVARCREVGGPWSELDLEEEPLPW